MREYEKQEEKAAEYGVISGERGEIYIFGSLIPTRHHLE
jgi:hypothetical protein